METEKITRIPELILQAKAEDNTHRSKLECFRCHKFGHYASECYSRLPNDREKGESSNFNENKEAEK